MKIINKSPESITIDYQNNAMDSEFLFDLMIFLHKNQKHYSHYTPKFASFIIDDDKISKNIIIMGSDEENGLKNIKINNIIFDFGAHSVNIINQIKSNVCENLFLKTFIGDQCPHLYKFYKDNIDFKYIANFKKPFEYTDINPLKSIQEECDYFNYISKLIESHEFCALFLLASIMSTLYNYPVPLKPMSIEVFLDIKNKKYLLSIWEQIEVLGMLFSNSTVFKQKFNNFKLDTSLFDINYKSEYTLKFFNNNIVSAKDLLDNYTTADFLLLYHFIQ